MLIQKQYNELTLQQRNATSQLDCEGNTTLFFIIQEAK